MRVFFIALDAADKDCILAWSESGLLPNFAELFKNSVSGIVDNPPGLYVGALWPSFTTACHPFRHGRYCYRQFRPDTCEITWVGANEVEGRYFWEHLDAAGKRTALIDIPKTVDRELANGVQVVDWMSHDPAFNSRFRTWPPSLEARVRARYGVDPVEGKCNRWPRYSGEDYRYLVEAIKKRMGAKKAFSANLWGEEEWDLFAVCFAEAHCIGHQAWHLHDPDHYGYDPWLAEQLGDPVLAIYQSLDETVGELARLAGNDSAFVVLASHGMGPHYDGDHLMTETLSRINQQLDFGLPESTSRVPALAREKAVHVPNNESFAGIRVNLAGRDPHGRIRPGAEYESYLAALTDELTALRDVDDDECVFTETILTAECYGCGHDHSLPDLMLRWSRRKPINGLRSSTVGEVRGDYQGIRTGDHLPEGMYWARIPSVPAGNGERIRNIDIGPTIGALLGERIPDVDGRVVASLLDAKA